MTTYNDYSAYLRAINSGRRNIRFINLNTASEARNPVTADNGCNCADSQSGDF
jgi:hypothetical protein